ncbi:MAG: nucleoside triphosphate pyrophosphohydrolase [Thermoflexales bacterium]|nr:nucleoside triphosphate pyrophosphohydrolase [Thermoflexales bacterium]
MVVLLGLGPGDPALVTKEAWETLAAAHTVYLRTNRHPVVAALPPHLTVHSFDALYERSAHFDEVYRAVADTVLAHARAKPDSEVIYATPGHPLVGEAASALILRRARQEGIAVHIVAGLSFVEPILETLALHADLDPGLLDPLAGLQVCDALEIAAAYHPPLNPDRPALIAQVYSRLVASDLKLVLMNQYPPGHPAWVVRATGDQRRCASVVLSELDHSDWFDHLTSVYLPPMPRPSSFEALQAVVAHLRAPEGCPWDREQTHESLRRTLLEETYEVLAAIDQGDIQALAEELGDLLLNVVMQAQIATEGEVFRMTDTIAHIIAKLKRRHPHVFGDAQAQTSSEVIAHWDAIKRQEKRDAGVHNPSALDGIAEALPALAFAQKVAHRADRAGFSWGSHEARLRKVREELEEILAARDDAHRAEEFGDLIFALANWADGYGIDLESAARQATQKFAQRFRALEQRVRAQGQDLKALPREQALALWQQVKADRLAEP